MSDRFRQCEELFHAASALSGSERAELLEKACAGDPELRVEVERLLAAHARLAGKAMEWIARAA